MKKADQLIRQNLYCAPLPVRFGREKFGSYLPGLASWVAELIVLISATLFPSDRILKSWLCLKILSNF